MDPAENTKCIFSRADLDAIAIAVAVTHEASDLIILIIVISDFATLFRIERIHPARPRHKSWKPTLLEIRVHVGLVLLELVAIGAPVIRITTPGAP